MTAGIAKITGWATENLVVRFIKDPEVAEIRLKYFVGGDFPILHAPRASQSLF